MSEPIVSKVCTKCQADKPLVDFSRRNGSPDGHRNDCKKCADSKQRERNSSPERLAAVRAAKRKYRQSSHGKRKVAEWMSSPDGKASIAASSSKSRQTQASRDYYRQYREKNKHKENARAAVAYEIRCGRLPKAKTQPCAYCGNPAVEHHHFKGYAEENWLDVKPTCERCHVEQDAILLSSASVASQE